MKRSPAQLDEIRGRLDEITSACEDIQSFDTESLVEELRSALENAFADREEPELDDLISNTVDSVADTLNEAAESIQDTLEEISDQMLTHHPEACGSEHGNQDHSENEGSGQDGQLPPDRQVFQLLYCRTFRIFDFFQCYVFQFFIQ